MNTPGVSSHACNRLGKNETQEADAASKAFTNTTTIQRDGGVGSAEEVELHTRIVRLTKAHVLLKAPVKDQTIGFSGTLCSAHWNDELPDNGLPATNVGRAGNYLITIDPTIAGLFGTSVGSSREAPWPSGSMPSSPPTGTRCLTY